MGNTVVDFTPEDKEPKRRSLNRLLTLLNQNSPDTTKVEPKSSNKNMLKNKNRTLHEIQGDFYSLVDEDQDLRKFLGTSSATEDNSLVSSLRAELLQELYQLVEVVLIDSHDRNGNPLPKDLLEKRLADTLNPKNSNQDNSAQLRIIDNFLSEKENKAHLKAAIRLIKPFFFAICSERLESEAARILGGFRISENANRALEQFLFFKHYGGNLRENQALQRYLTRHPMRHKLELLDQQRPESSAKQARRDLLDVLGIGIDSNDASVSLDDREKKMTENVRQHQRKHSRFISYSEYPEEAFAKLRKQQLEDKLKTPFDQNAPADGGVPEEDVLALGNLQW